MKDHFKERSTRDYHQKQLFTKSELEEREHKCVHEQPPFCLAACPLKLDGREFMRLAAAGNFAAARAMLERITSFPEILVHGCEAPCEGACRLREVGESMDFSAIERAVMRLGAPRTGKGLLKFKKKKTAAVFGSELFTLLTAGEMDTKSYPTTLYVEEADALSLITKCAPFLPQEAMEKAAERLKKMDLKVVYGCEDVASLFLEKKGEYDLIFAAGGFSAEKPDPVTLVGEGRVLFPSGEETDQPILHTFYDARRACVSADRMAQNLDPATLRGEEGPVESRLFTNMSEVKPTNRVPEAEEGYSREEAICEAKRCIQCECIECLKGCAYLRHYDKFPRILTREIYNNTGIIMGDHMMNKPMNSCSLCGQCTVTCPNGYDMGEICRLARENMVDTGKMSLAVHEFALLDMLFSNSEAFLARPQAGYGCADDKDLPACRYAFFPGCQAGAIAPEAVFRAYEDLCRRLPGGVALVLGCCSAIAKWAGRREMHQEQTEFLKGELEKLGNPILIAGCPTCKKTLEQDGMGEVKGIWDVLLELGLPEGAACTEQTAVMHDSCASRGDHEMQGTVRKLAENLGCTLKETKWSGDLTECCGYGGLVSYTNKEVASEMAKDCLKEAPDLPYITYCMACRDRLAREGAQSMHLLELIYNAPAGESPDISERRKNRLLLKERMLREFWKEDVMEEKRDFRLTILPEARQLMDERMILDTDVLQVMQAYRENGEAVIDLETGLLVTRHRIGNVTFWVKFTEEEDGYTVQRAYSHRMTIQTR